MNGSKLIQALRSGDRAYGTLVTSSSPHLAPRLRDVGLDFVFIDTKGGADDANAASAVKISDLIVSTIIPTPVNMTSLEASIRHFRDLKRWNPNVELRFLLCAVNESKAIAREALELKNTGTAPFFDTVLHQSAALENTLGEHGGPLTSFAGLAGFNRANLELSHLANACDRARLGGGASTADHAVRRAGVERR